MRSFSRVLRLLGYSTALVTIILVIALGIFAWGTEEQPNPVSTFATFFLKGLLFAMTMVIAGLPLGLPTIGA